MEISFTPDAWEEYLWWQKQDRKSLKRINMLIEDIQRNGYQGIGKPERLKENLSGLYSRRLDDTNRVVYRIRNETIEIIQCKGHYKDK